jgi:mannose-1-phosphate guanylyltransferase
MLEAYKQYRPDWYEALMKIRDVLDKPGEDSAVEEIYSTMEKGPTEEVTKNIMHKGEARIILLPFKWTDIGTWSSVYEFFAHGDGGNYEEGRVVTVETRGSLIKTSNDNKLIAVAGMDNVVIVDTEDVLLVIPKDKIEKIKDIQDLLKDRGRKEYL